MPYSLYLPFFKYQKREREEVEEEEAEKEKRCKITIDHGLSTHSRVFSHVLRARWRVGVSSGTRGHTHRETILSRLLERASARARARGV